MKLIKWLKTWNIMRFLRLLLAIFVIFQGIEINHVGFIFAGGIFALLPLFNIGCGSSSACSLPVSSHKK
ncbi:hypothetical protein K5I29_05165 [Flavobacterium agricola]|uniref:DUF2892 family protein n=1 Tax=Flavobacterium agricola TaxID=2870839 RepID=A0ABY6M355_9FLAO|nr:hypothetical protein [Flavobacterium agricola]UYW02292.1 hypothetical protein K5I29_05165 [Flavobacterium agricola]